VARGEERALTRDLRRAHRIAAWVLAILLPVAFAIAVWPR